MSFFQYWRSIKSLLFYQVVYCLFYFAFLRRIHKLEQKFVWIVEYSTLIIGIQLFCFEYDHLKADSFDLRFLVFWKFIIVLFPDHPEDKAIGNPANSASSLSQTWLAGKSCFQFWYSILVEGAAFSKAKVDDIFTVRKSDWALTHTCSQNYFVFDVGLV